VRLFLDAHVSARRIATALGKQHDVRAADEERVLDGWEDERLLDLATADRRAMITFNVKDFARITTQWGAAGSSHAGCLLIVGIDHAEFGLILRVIEHALSTRPDQAAWLNYTARGTRSASVQAAARGDRAAGLALRRGRRPMEH
jgi:hypothetical protein